MLTRLITAFFGLNLLLFNSSTKAYAVPINEVCNSKDQCYAPLSSLEIIFSNLLNIITIAGGFAIIAVLIIGAFRYMVARGDEKSIMSARSQLTWGFLGLFFLIASWLILAFISQFTGLELTKFCLGLNC